MVGTLDFHGGDGRALERGEQHAAQRVADGVAVAGLEGLGDELGVGFCGGVLDLGEGLRHFETS